MLQNEPNIEWIAGWVLPKLQLYFPFQQQKAMRGQIPLCMTLNPTCFTFRSNICLTGFEFHWTHTNPLVWVFA